MVRELTLIFSATQAVSAKRGNFGTIAMAGMGGTDGSARQSLTAMWRVESSIYRPVEEIGRACSHIPELTLIAASSLALLMSSTDPSNSDLASLQCVPNLLSHCTHPYRQDYIRSPNHCHKATSEKEAEKTNEDDGPWWDVPRIADMKSAEAEVETR